MPNNLYVPYKKGDILLSFKKKNSNLITIWKEIHPMVSNFPNEGICFEIQNNDNGSIMNADEQQVAYTDDELQDMALQYYTMINGYAPSYVDVDTVLDDNMVMIHLYDLNEQDSVGFTSTYDWCTVNRYTAKGYDFNENEIDLTDVSGD